MEDLEAKRHTAIESVMETTRHFESLKRLNHERFEKTFLEAVEKAAHSGNPEPLEARYDCIPTVVQYMGRTVYVTFKDN